MQYRVVLWPPAAYKIVFTRKVTDSRVEDREKVIKVGNYVVRITDA